MFSRFWSGMIIQYKTFRMVKYYTYTSQLYWLFVQCTFFVQWGFKILYKYFISYLLLICCFCVVFFLGFTSFFYDHFFSLKIFLVIFMMVSLNQTKFLETSTKTKKCFKFGHRIVHVSLKNQQFKKYMYNSKHCVKSTCNTLINNSLFDLLRCWKSKRF